MTLDPYPRVIRIDFGYPSHPLKLYSGNYRPSFNWCVRLRQFVLNRE
jgi:hypothetical protein